jgi:hypothetical protein
MYVVLVWVWVWVWVGLFRRTLAQLIGGRQRGCWKRVWQ